MIFGRNVAALGLFPPMWPKKHRDMQNSITGPLSVKSSIRFSYLFHYTFLLHEQFFLWKRRILRSLKRAHFSSERNENHCRRRSKSSNAHNVNEICEICAWALNFGIVETLVSLFIWMGWTQTQNSRSLPWNQELLITVITVESKAPTWSSSSPCVRMQHFVSL